MTSVSIFTLHHVKLGIFIFSNTKLTTKIISLKILK